MTMSYFRRPALVGKNIQRTAFATIRGSLRRSDADGTSPAPYFPDVTIGQTLQVGTSGSGGILTVSLTSQTLAGILSDLNSALGVNGVAADADGVIELRDSVAGSLGVVAVFGGTAASALGFETFGGTRTIIAVGGQVKSSPEGRVGNPFDVAIVGRGENFTTESVQRGMVRLATNSDVIWSEHVRDLPSVRKLALGSDYTVSSDGKYITLDNSIRIFATAAQSSIELSSFFQLVDEDNKSPSVAKVVDVVRGVPTGEPPYSPSPGYSDTTGLSILGSAQTKVTETITTISEGRYVECSGATFVTDGVVPGDLCTISGSTNVTPWSNGGGGRWIVENVLDETRLVLRPASSGEFSGGSGPHADVDLNESLGSGESYGSLIITTGLYPNKATLVVRPAIPPGANVSLYAAIPRPYNEGLVDSLQDRAGLWAAQSSLLDSTENWILFGLDTSLVGSDIFIDIGYVRWHGVAYQTGGVTFTPSDFTDNATNYIYWSEQYGDLRITTNTADFSNTFSNSFNSPGSKGQLVAQVVLVSGAITSYKKLVRRRAERVSEFTVGSRGQFETLSAAILYASKFNLTTLNKFVLLESISEAVLIDFSLLGSASVELSGRPGVTLTLTGTGSNGVLIGGSQNLRITDLTVVRSSFPLIYTSGGSSLTMERVTTSSSIFSASDLTIKAIDCTITTTSSSFSGTVVGNFLRTTINASAGNMFGSFGTVTFRDCTISLTGTAVISNGGTCYMYGGSLSANSSATVLTGTVVLDSVIITNATNLVSTTNLSSSVRNCRISTKLNASGVLIQAGIVQNCRIDSTSFTSLTGIAASALGSMISGNVLTGHFAIGILASATYTSLTNVVTTIVGNELMLTNPTTTPETRIGIKVQSYGTLVRSNVINFSGGSLLSSQTVYGISVTESIATTIHDNWIYITSGNSDWTGIRLIDGANVQYDIEVDGNKVWASAFAYKADTGNSSIFSATRNNVFNGPVANIGNIIANNEFYTDVAACPGFYVGNYFNGTGTISLAYNTGDIHSFLFEGNSFRMSSVLGLTVTTDVSSILFKGNRVEGTSFTIDASGTTNPCRVELTSNFLALATTLSGDEVVFDSNSSDHNVTLTNPISINGNRIETGVLTLSGNKKCLMSNNFISYSIPTATPISPVVVGGISDLLVSSNFIEAIGSVTGDCVLVQSNGTPSAWTRVQFLSNSFRTCAATGSQLAVRNTAAGNVVTYAFHNILYYSSLAIASGDGLSATTGTSPTVKSNNGSFSL